MRISQTIAPCVWFDDQAEEAANFYTRIFRNSAIVSISRYGEAGRDTHYWDKLSEGGNPKVGRVVDRGTQA
jgi:predicted 3-demethylubiquinone-9 3-methyltransferase (glyoxalase superfamily)